MSFFAARNFAPAGKRSTRVARLLFHRCSLFASRFQPSLLSLISRFCKSSRSSATVKPALRKWLDAGDQQSPVSGRARVLGSERWTGALLDRLPRHIHILEMNGESYRLK